MNKYTLVLYRGAQENFLQRLQELGLVDITTAGWEPDEEEHQILSLIDRHRAAVERLKVLAAKPEFQGAEPFADGDEAFARYSEASHKIESLEGQIAKTRKEADELAAWGDFSPAKIAALADDGIVLHFYQCYSSEYDHNVEAWSEHYTIEQIAEVNGTTFFVAVTSASDQKPSIDAQVVHTPTQTAADKEREIVELETQFAELNGVMARCVASVDKIASHGDELKNRLQFSQVSHSGESEVEDRIVVLEGFAPVENEKDVDALLDASPDMFYIKSKPSVDDDTPVKLKNNRFAQVFQIVGDFYALPKYGTMDLTPYFAPFYMMFFGFCVGDAGYGLLFLLIGLFIYFKKMKGMKLISQLVIWLGVGSVLFGMLIGSFFGTSLGDWLPLADSYKDIMKFVNDNLFYISLCVGGVQIIFGLILNVINTSIVHGFKYSFATLGWLLVLLSCVLAFLLPAVGVTGYSFGSVPFYVTAGLGAVLMLFLNNPNRNPIINFGAGLWGTYNNITGLLGDVLSYVRLFALALSGSALAVVFNDLAASLAPEMPVVRQLVMFVILAFGHGMNIFMSAIGAFVHPMRLTFVEFYKNAGFEAATRAYTPFEKIK